MPQGLVRDGAVTPSWSGKAVVCIATGPSLTEAQLRAVQAAREADAVRVIVVNDAYLVAPFADLLYYADEKWRRWQVGGIVRAWPWRRFTAADVSEAWAAFAGQRCSIGTKVHADTEYLRIWQTDGISTDPAMISTGSNGGHQALNIAVLAGGNPVLLLGYDAQPSGKRKHAFGDHPDGTEAPYDHMKRAMRTTVRPLQDLGARVINCSPGSGLDCFERGAIDAALAGLLPDPAPAGVPA